jgi:hypothetical protein
MKLAAVGTGPSRSKSKVLASDLSHTKSPSKVSLLNGN